MTAIIKTASEPFLHADPHGNMLESVVHGADVQDRDGAPGLIERSCGAYPTLTKLLADGGYAGKSSKRRSRTLIG